MNNADISYQTRSNPIVRLIILLIRCYQRSFGIILPGVCRFVPSCSEYTIEALVRFGIIKGGFMSIFRILRCNPFFPGGYDPVSGIHGSERNHKHGE